MKKFRISDLDMKYVKICSYAGVTIIITAIALVLLYMTGDFWTKLWSLITAILKPVIVGSIFAYLLHPVAVRIRNRLDPGLTKKWSLPASVLLSLVLVLTVIGAIIAVIAVTTYTSVSSINISDLKDIPAYLEREFSFLIDLFNNLSSNSNTVVDTARKLASSLITGISNAGSTILFGAIFSVYLLLDTNNILGYWKRVLKILTNDRFYDRMRAFMSDANMVFSRYIRGQFLDAAIIGVATSVTMLIIGVPSGVVVGLLTGIGNLIPYVGPVVGYVTLILVCLSMSAWKELLIGAICLAILMFVDSNIVNPRLLSNNIEIHPLLVMLALIGGGAIGGFLGMIVAVPCAALIKLQFDKYLAKLETSRQKAKAAASGEAPQPEPAEDGK